MNSNINGNTVSLKDEFCVWSDAGKAYLDNEVNGEYVLPDYLPDIRKILMVNVGTEGENVYVDDGRIEIGGEAVFKVIYLGNEGNIRSVIYKAQYSGNVTLDGIYGDSIIDVKTKINNKTVRALSPRKLSLKSALTTSVKVKNKLCVSPRLTGHSGVEDEFKLERKQDNIKAVNYVKLNDENIRVSEDITYEGRNGISDVICCDVKVFPTDCRYSQGKVTVKGTAVASFMLVNEEEGDGITENYEYIEKKLPIEHIFDTSLTGEGWECLVKFEVAAFEYGIANDNYGENRIIELDFDCKASVTAVRNEDSIFTSDVFSTEYDCANTLVSVETEKMVKCVYTNFSVSGSTEISSNDVKEPEKNVLWVAEPHINDVVYKNGKMSVIGECTVRSVVKEKDGGYINQEFSFPIKYELAAEEAEFFDCRCECGVINSRISLNDKKVSADIEVGLHLSVFEKVKKETVDVINLDKSSPIPKNSERVMVLYYPEKNETVWDIAKRYKVNRAELTMTNKGLNESNIPRVIVIPAKINEI